MANKMLFLVLIFAVFQLAMNVHLLKLYDTDGFDLDIDFDPDKDFPSIETDRPWMVIHVGPPKTGTTTIQTGLTQYCPSLANLDNIFYLGQTSSGAKVVPKTEYIRYTDNINSTNNGTLPIFPARPLFLGSAELFQTLKLYHKQKHNVLLSSEHFTSKIPPKAKRGQFFERIFNNVFLLQGERRKHTRPSVHRKIVEEGPKVSIGGTRRRRKSKENHRRLVGIELDGSIAAPKARNAHRREIVATDPSSRFGFNVKIVVNYRHYFQWLPSYYFQSELMNERSGAQTLRAFIQKAIDGLGKEYLVDGETIKNTSWSEAMPQGLKKVHGTLWSYIMWSSPLSLRNRVEIFDFHQQEIVLNGTETSQEEDTKEQNLFRNFVCQTLPTATKTCSQLHEANETLLVRVRGKSGLGSSLETGKLSDTQLYQLKSAAFDRLPELQDDQSGPTNFTMNYDVNLADSVFQFRRARGKVETFILANFYDWVEQRNASTAPDDGHRQLCLSDESTQALKAVSWNMLRHLEALVRIRDKNRREVASEQLDKIFEAPAIHRAKHPLLLSPHKYDDHILLESQSNEKDEDWWAHIKRNHDKLFEQTVESGAYCELDLDRLFADENFVRQIFYRADDYKQRTNFPEYRIFDQ